ncbi:hypothetical protein Tco_0235836 [Tanacetum coccineum]
MLTNKGWLDGHGSNLGGRFGKTGGGQETHGGGDGLEGPGSSLRALLYDLGDSLVIGKSPLSEGGDSVEDEVLDIIKSRKTTYGFIESEKRLETYSLKEREHVVFSNEGWSNDSSFVEETLFKNAQPAENHHSTRSVVEEVTAVTIPISAATTTTTINAITDVERTLAQALAELKSAKPKADKVVIQELEQEARTYTNSFFTTTIIGAKIEADYQLAQRLQAQEQEELTNEEKARLFVQLLEQRRKHFAAKRAEEKRNRPPTRAQQRSIMCTYLKNMEGWKPKSLKNKSFVNIQELFNKAMEMVNTFVDYRTKLVEESSKKAEAEITYESSLKRAGEELEQESSKKQKLEEDKESKELKQCLEIIPNDGDDVTINATPLSTKSPTIVDYEIYKEGKKSYFQIIRADVKARFKKIEPVNYMDNFLLLNLKTMFEHHVEVNVWKNQQGLVKLLNWKLYDSCGVHYVTMQSMLFYLLVEKMYPLTNHTLHQMFNDVKLQVDYKCEMAFELLRLVKK